MLTSSRASHSFTGQAIHQSPSIHAPANLLLCSLPPAALTSPLQPFLQVGALYDAAEDGEGSDPDVVEGPEEDEPVVVIPFAEACMAATSAAEEDEGDEHMRVDGRLGDVEGEHTPWLRAGAYAWAVSGSGQVKIEQLQLVM